MATDYTHLPEGSVSEVLKLVVLEHRELRAQYKEVSNRIRDLRIAVKTLRNLGGNSPIRSRREKISTPVVQNEPACDPKPGLETKPEDAQALENHRVALQRAIRIAVFETAEPASDAEVHARILRRGSFSFASEVDAAHAIAEELQYMADQGELRRIECVTGNNWRRL